MFKYVDLCIELKKGRHAKDGLIHYRNICQQVRFQTSQSIPFLQSRKGKGFEASPPA